MQADVEHELQLTPARKAYLRVALRTTGDPAAITILARHCLYNVAQAEQTVPYILNQLIRTILETPPQLRLTIHCVPSHDSSTGTAFQAQTTSGTLHLLGTDQRYALPLDVLRRHHAPGVLEALAEALDPASPGALPETQCQFAGIERRELRPDQRTLYEYAGDAELAQAYQPALLLGTILLGVVGMARALEISSAARRTLLRDATSALENAQVTCHRHAESNARSEAEVKRISVMLHEYFEERQTLDELYDALREWRLAHLKRIMPLLELAHASVA